MAGNTSFLADNDREDDFEQGRIRLEDSTVAPANSYFKKPLRAIAAVTLILTLLLFVFFLGTCAYISTGPFENPWSQRNGASILILVVRMTTSFTCCLNCRSKLTAE
jgi:hypothetical protein